MIRVSSILSIGFKKTHMLEIDEMKWIPVLRATLASAHGARLLLRPNKLR
jgi:hypothetical protein